MEIILNKYRILCRQDCNDIKYVSDIIRSDGTNVNFCIPDEYLGHRDILGITDDAVIAVDNDVLKLFSLVESFEFLGKFENDEILFRALYDSIEPYGLFDNYRIYTSGYKKVIVVLSTMFIPIDDKNFFWKFFTGSYTTLMTLYTMLFDYSIEGVDKNTDAYFCSDSFYYRYILNEKIIRFMTKLAVLRR